MSLILIILIAISGIFVTSGPEVVPVERPCVQDVQGNCVPEPAEGWNPVSFDGFEGVIVPAEAAGDDGWLASDEAWTPTEKDVVAAEVAIEAEQGPLDHMRQYIGITQDGEQKVFVNGFCDAWETNWQAQIIFVNDGGECYFGATYNVETGELESFVFNGDA